MTQVCTSQQRSSDFEYLILYYVISRKILKAFLEKEYSITDSVAQAEQSTYFGMNQVFC